MQEVIVKKTQTMRLELLMIVSFTLFMILASFLRVYLFFSPVPITFQTFALFLCAAFLKDKSYIPVAAYLIAGAAGAPVFGGAGGIFYIFGPTGGYLMGFLIAVTIAGDIIRNRDTNNVKKEGILYYAFLFTLINVIIYVCGALWLVGVYRASALYAFNIGIMPFIIPDIVKIILASLISYRFIRR